MSTKLWIETSTGVEEAGDPDTHETFLELSEDFLFNFFTKDEMLKVYLASDEIRYITPNWGEVELKSTESLDKDDRQKYLALLKEVMRTNSSANLNSFLKEKGMTSDKIVDREKSALKVLEIVTKFISGLGDNRMTETGKRSPKYY